MVKAEPPRDVSGDGDLSGLSWQSEDQSGLGIDIQRLRKPRNETLIADLVAPPISELAIVGLHQEVKVDLKTRGPILKISNVLHVRPSALCGFASSRRPVKKHNAWVDPRTFLIGILLKVLHLFVPQHSQPSITFDRVPHKERPFGRAVAF